MTGNTALLGIAISEGDLLAASKPFAPLLGFVVGAAFASAGYGPRRSGGPPSSHRADPAAVRDRLSRRVRRRPANWPPTRDPGVILDGLILLCSIVNGDRGIAAKSVNVPGISTIVFTSTLAGIVQSATEILLRRKDTLNFRSDTKVQIAIFGAYGAGAVLAGVLEWNEFAWLAFMPEAR